MATETLRLAESKLRLVMSFTAPPMLVALAILLSASDVAIWVPIVIGAVGALLTLFVLVDFATTIDIGPEGIVRNAPVRRAVIDWANVEKLVVPKRGGLAVVTLDGRHIILLDRKLVSHEVEMAKAQARESGVGVETLTRKSRFGA